MIEHCSMYTFAKERESISHVKQTNKKKKKKQKPMSNKGRNWFKKSV